MFIKKYSIFRSECNKRFLLRLALNKVRIIYLCYQHDLIIMHKSKPEVTPTYHICKCFVIGSQSPFVCIENVYTRPEKSNKSSKIYCIYNAIQRSVYKSDIRVKKERSLKFFSFSVSLSFSLGIHPRVYFAQYC